MLCEDGYLLAKSIHKHPYGWSGPHHEGRVAARIPSKVHLKLLGRLQQACEEDVAEFVDVEQRGSFYAKLPYGCLDGSCAVLQKQLTGFGGLTCTIKKQWTFIIIQISDCGKSSKTFVH